MTSVLWRHWGVSAFCLLISVNTAYAGDIPITADQASQLKAYMAKVPLSPKSAHSKRAPSVTGVESASEAVALTTNSAQTVNPARAEPDTVITPNTRSLLEILDAPAITPGALTRGLSTGLGVQPQPSLSHQATQAIVAALKTPNHRTAEEAAALADALATTPTPTDPALDERIILARAVLQIDGTEALIRKYVETQYMPAIVAELVKHIDLSKLSETDKYRLTAILTVAQTELADKIVLLNARIQAQTLNKAELTQLLAAYDIDAQRKLTNMRLHDDGKVDRAAELDIRLAQFQMVKLFEATP